MIRLAVEAVKMGLESVNFPDEQINVLFREQIMIVADSNGHLRLHFTGGPAQQRLWRSSGGHSDGAWGWLWPSTNWSAWCCLQA
jgi:hypothetical protein